jgi:hypothetical protein
MITHRSTMGRSLRFAWLTAALVTLTACTALGGQEQNVEILIKADGTCLIRQTQIILRRDFEQMLKYSLREESGDESEDNEESADSNKEGKEDQPSQPAKAKTLSDAEMIAAVKKMSEAGQGFFSDAKVSSGMESISVENDNFRLVITNSYLSMKEMLSGSDWKIPMFYSSSFVIAKKGTNQLQITYSTRMEESESFVERRLTAFKRQGIKMDYRITFPGKILSSGFSNINDKTTWITFDPKDRESLSNTLQIIQKPVQIVAELGGLEINEPLNSVVLEDQEGKTEAPGNAEPSQAENTNYMAHLQSISLRTTYTFPSTNTDAKTKRTSESWRMYGSKPGISFQAIIQPPPGRKILSVSKLRVVKAIDNRGQPLKLKEDAAKPKNDSKTPANAPAVIPTVIPENNPVVPTPTPIPSPEPQSVYSMEGGVVTLMSEPPPTENEGEPDEPEDNAPDMPSVPDMQIPEAAAMEGGIESTTVFTQNQNGTALLISWELPLPSPEVSSIEDMELTAVARSFSDWKTLTITNLQLNATNQIDLASLIPGARATVTQVKTGKRGKSMEVRIDGPVTIQDLELSMSSTGEDENRSSMSERNFINKGNQSIRKISLQTYDYSESKEKKEEPPVLVIRFPEDSKREPIRFHLVGLDIY